jgi:hypothetical protein
MPWVGFEPTIPAFERAKRVHALDHAPTVIGECGAVGGKKVSRGTEVLRGNQPQYHSVQGRAIAQAVSRRLPNAVARLRAHVRSCEFCGGQRCTGAVFLLVLRFPLPILVPPTVPHSSSIIRGSYNRPFSGWRTKRTQSYPPQETKKNLSLCPPQVSHDLVCDWIWIYSGKAGSNHMRYDKSFHWLSD